MLLRSALTRSSSRFFGHSRGLTSRNRTNTSRFKVFQCCYTTTAKYENILVETKGAVGFITLNRPKVLNALNDALMRELNLALQAFDADPQIGCIVITGQYLQNKFSFLCERKKSSI
jgi:1,4-dihydroxy-2-naphthoyl-CoA synthase